MAMDDTDRQLISLLRKGIANTETSILLDSYR